MAARGDKLSYNITQRVHKIKTHTVLLTMHLLRAFALNIRDILKSELLPCPPPHWELHWQTVLRYSNLIIPPSNIDSG